MLLLVHETHRPPGDPLTALRVSALTLVVLCCVPVSGAAQARELRGDSTAVAAVNRMLEETGGTALWGEGRTLQVEYRVWLAHPRAQVILERAWRDLWEPNQRIELRGDSVQITSVMSATGGWRTRNGRPATDPDALARDRVFWWRDYYTLFHRFAVRDTDLTVLAGPENRVIVQSARQGEIGWFEVGSDGAPVRWGTLDGGAPLAYVYGPLRDFGRVRFPAWGANLDGSWRFEYLRVSLGREAIRPELLTRPF